MSAFWDEVKRQGGGNWMSFGMGGGGGTGDDGSAQAAAAEAQLKLDKAAAKADLEEAFSGYGLEDPNSKYFKNIGRKYTNFAMNAPVTGIRDQRTSAMDDLVAQLSRQGMLNSTVRTNREALAKKLFGKGQVDAATKGHEVSEGVRGTLSEAKGLALADIRDSTDPAGAAQSAMSGMMAKSQPGKFDPILDVFLKLTQGLATRHEAEKRQEQRDMIASYYGRDSSTIVRGG